MLRKGPVSRLLHGVWEYVISVLLIASPFLFDFEGGPTAVAIVLGVALIALAAASEGVSGLANQVPLSAHALVDYVVAGVLIASPFLFGFSDEGEPTALFLVLGVGHLVLSIGTRYRPEPVEDPTTTI